MASIILRGIVREFSVLAIYLVGDMLLAAICCLLYRSYPRIHAFARILIRIVWRFPGVAFFPKARPARNILLHGWLLTVLFIAAAADRRK